MQKRQILSAPYTLTLFLPDDPPQGMVFIPSHGDAQAVCDALPGISAALVFIEGFDWNRDLSPWPAKAVFGNDDFAGCADDFLDALICRLIPLAEQEAGFTPLWRGLAGYSLAGLFAVYAAYRCDEFTRVASASGSMWYDGWLDYAQRTPLAAAVTHAYFSVGDKEKRTRNARMAAVEDCTRAMADLLASRGARTSFVLNPGNHFTAAQERLSAAIAFLTT